MKTNHKILIVGVVILLLASVGWNSTRKNSENNYRLSVDTTLKEVLKFNEILRPEQVAEIIFTKDTVHYQFIDLRTPAQFLKGHIPTAINIPVHQVLNPKYKSILQQGERINIFYTAGNEYPCAPWLLLKQLGAKNNFILLGGYEFTEKYILSNFSPKSHNYHAEKALYDYKKVFSNSSGAAAGNNAATPPPPPPAGGKPASTGGGC